MNQVLIVLLSINVIDHERKKWLCGVLNVFIPAMSNAAHLNVYKCSIFHVDLAHALYVLLSIPDFLKTLFDASHNEMFIINRSEFLSSQKKNMIINIQRSDWHSISTWNWFKQDGLVVITISFFLRINFIEYQSKQNSIQSNFNARSEHYIFFFNVS